MAHRIALLSSEVAPFAKTGGLADVTAGLAKYLRRSGHDVRTFMPGYAQIDRGGVAIEPVAAAQNLPLTVGPHEFRFSLSETRIPQSDAVVYFIECPALYARRSLYTFDPDEHVRFIALTRAVFAVCQHLAWSPSIFNCNDWHTGFAPLLLKNAYNWDQLFAGSKSLLTIHNIGYQGVFPAAAIGDLDLGTNTFLLHQDDLRAGFINPLKHGILYADAVTTVSPTHAKEIMTPRYGMGLDDVLRGRAEPIIGILNGVDYEDWDPRHDRYLPIHFDPDHMELKARLKREFLLRLHLPAGEHVPLVGIVSRMAGQKGFELMFESLPKALRERDLCVVALGSGEERYEQFFGRLQRDFSHRVVFHRGYSDELAHWIEAASDMFLMPSLYEPCGLNQMYSLRYGTVPIVRHTGGLADSVENYDPVSREGTGIVFDGLDGESLLRVLHQALDLYQERPHWQRLVRNGMLRDFSWDTQGAQYVELYTKLAPGSV
jgi:starch synthase